MIISSFITSQLQPLDVLVNKPFHHIVRKHYDAWLNKDNHILTPSGKIKRASASVIAELISKAWKETPVIIIPKSFSSVVCLMRKTEVKMTYSGTTASYVVRVHHLQKMKMRLKNRWTNFVIK
jgi:hypothetical protein